MKQKIKDDISKAVEENGQIAITTDLWNDDYKRVSYMAMTAHYLKESENGLTLHNKITSLVPLDAGVSKTHDYLRTKLENEMENIGINDPLEKVHFITDRGKQCSCFSV